jgi:hypothetical protein
LSPTGNSIFYDAQFANVSEIKIIKRDLPLVGFIPVKISRKDPFCPFFLMLTPLRKYRTFSKSRWASVVMGEDADIKEVFDYYECLWEKNNHSKISKSVLDDLKNLVNLFLPYE